MKHRAQLTVTSQRAALGTISGLDEPMMILSCWEPRRSRSEVGCAQKTRKESGADEEGNILAVQGPRCRMQPLTSSYPHHAHTQPHSRK
jgi:hypothetical protein